MYIWSYFGRRSRKSLIFSAFFITSVVFTSLALAEAPDDAVVEELPYCGDDQPSELPNNRDAGKRLIYVTTLDGQLSALDMVNGGEVKWTVETGGELLSSSIQNLELTNNGQLVRIIPGLSGSLYQLTGKTVEAIPITAERLLSLSYKFSDDLVISGGKDTRSYGISARTGQMIYECTMAGCRNESLSKMDQVLLEKNEGTFQEDNRSKSEQSHDLFLDDVVVIRRETQTVRAIDPRTGVERWNFSVGNHELHMSSPRDCHSVNTLDLSDIDLRVVVPEGLICAYSKKTSVLLWQHQFDFPIVNAWRYDSGELNKVDLFSSVQWMWDRESTPEFSTIAKSNPALYIGLYNKQLYVQESPNMRRRLDLLLEGSGSGKKEEKNALSLPLKPLPAVKTDLMLLDTEDKPLDEKQLLEQYALMTINNQWPNYYGGKGGFYLFDETETSTSKCRQGNDTDRKGLANETNSVNDGANRVTLVSLWYWWKEIFVISVTSALVLNLFLNNSARKKRDTMGVEPEKENVVVERYIEIPIPVEKSVASSDKSKSSQLSHIMGSADNFSSRFLSDFDMIQCLGKGGFGVVFEAKNKLDDCRYAIKRILLPNKQESRDRVMREVKTLANCEHHNIVRFFQAWVETPPPGWQEDQDQFWLTHQDSIMSTSIDIETSADFSKDVRTFNSGEIHSLRLKTSPGRGIYSELKTNECLSLDADEVRKTWFVAGKEKSVETESESSEEGFFERPKMVEFDEDDDSFIEFRHSTTHDQAMTDHHSTNGTTSQHSSENYSETAKDNDTERQKHKRHLSWSLSEKGVAVLSQPRLEKMYLYIQMQLCQKQSLKEWLQITGETSRKGKIVSIFEQIVGAVEYVHLKGLIHRDLKPSNIFFALDNTIKIGDFGLVTDMEDNTACEEDEQPPKNGKSVNRKQFDLEQKMKKHTQQVGTHLYMSPEQIEGKPYHYKVDIYSLGLILFELLWVFSTEMERIKTLTSLRQSEFPPEFAVSFASEFELLKLMLAKCPQQRPTTFGIRARPPLSHNGVNHQLHFDLPSRQSRSISVSISQEEEFK